MTVAATAREDLAPARHGELVEPSVDAALDRAATYAAAARATSTRAAYRSDWEHFHSWAQGAGRSALPATAETAVGFKASGRVPSLIKALA